MIDPESESDAEEPAEDESPDRWTSIDGKRVAWSRIHEATGARRKGVAGDRLIRRRGFDFIGGILQGSVKKHGLAARIGASMVLDLFATEVKARIPEEMHGKFRALHIRHDTLTVACLSSGVAFTIRRHEIELLEVLKEAGSDVTIVRTILSTWR